MKTILTAIAAIFTVAGVAQADRASTISIVGSSTVYPFATQVAENFSEFTGYNAPIIESTGSGGGLKLFCAGVGLEHPDVTNASRQIKSSEAETCAANGVEVEEYLIGYDGIVIANSLDGPSFDLTIEDIIGAVAEVVFEDGSLVPNKNKFWSDIRSDLPNVEILVLGPPTSSGTRDAFEELVIHKYFKAAGLSKSEYKSISVREDGAYVESGENDNLIIDQLSSDETAVGIFGYSFLVNNMDVVKAADINGFEAELDNIATGDYPISRSLFFYVKANHYGVVEGLEDYVDEFMSDYQIGPDGALVDIGLIPTN